MVRRTPAYAPLVHCSSFEILSALSVSADKWTCRVRVRPAGSSSAPFAVAQAYAEYTWQLSKQPECEGIDFDLGQCLQHKKYAYRGVIVGYDRRCSATDEWIEAMGVDTLPGGREQPFYHVLVDVRDRPGAQMTYVAQENIELDAPPEPLQHPKSADLLVASSFDAERGTFEPKATLRALYPRGVDGCWMVDGVMPDRPVVEG